MTPLDLILGLAVLGAIVGLCALLLWLTVGGPRP